MKHQQQTPVQASQQRPHRTGAEAKFSQMFHKAVSRAREIHQQTPVGR